MIRVVGRGDARPASTFASRSSNRARRRGAPREDPVQLLELARAERRWEMSVEAVVVALVRPWRSQSRARTASLIPQRDGAAPPVLGRVVRRHRPALAGRDLLVGDRTRTRSDGGASRAADPCTLLRVPAQASSTSSDVVALEKSRAACSSSHGLAEDVDGDDRPRALGDRGLHGRGIEVLTSLGSMSANTGVAPS